MKNVFIFFVSFICIIPIFCETIIPEGNVSGEWAVDGSPYLVEGDISIPDGETLYIHPGCLIEFQDHYWLNIQGRLLAIGTEQDSVKFTISDTTGFTNKFITDGGWCGFKFDHTPATNDSSKISYSIIEYVKGSVYIEGGNAIYNFDKLFIANCNFRNNYSRYGGAFYIYYSTCTIQNSLFNKNTASIGEALYIYAGSNSVRILNNIFTNNFGHSSVIAGGAFFINNTVCYNMSSTSSIIDAYYGGTFINNIIWFNQSNYVNNNPLYTTFQNCNIQNGLLDYPNYYDTNIDLDPFFISENDYHLNPISSCINRGIPDTIGLNLPNYDFDGNSRIYEGENPRIDIGAYEYQGEPILFFPDFTINYNHGIIPFTVQFTDLSEGEIVSWEWDFNNDGLIDSYEQNPQYTYNEAGLYDVALTIYNDSASLTKTRYDYIEVSDEYSYYEEIFSFSKIDTNDNLCFLQLFDVNCDGIKEIYLTYINSESHYWRVLGINNNGNIILNHTESYNYIVERLDKIRLFEKDNEYYIITVSVESPASEDHIILTRLFSLDNFTLIASNSYELFGNYSIGIYDLKFQEMNNAIIFVGYRSEWEYGGGVCGGSDYDLIKLNFDSNSLSFWQNQPGGKKIYPNSNLSTRFSDWWDDLGYEGSSAGFYKLDTGNSFFNFSDPRIYVMLTTDDGSYEDYGSVLYYASDTETTGKMLGYSTDYNEVLWELPITLYTGGSWNATLQTATINISYEGENHYLLFFNYLDDSINIIDRLTGNIVYSEYSSLKPFAINKTASNDLLLIESNDDEYTVYTNDSNYFTNIHNIDIPNTLHTIYLSNYPNPFNPSTTIEFSVPDYNKVSLTIYNIKGQKVIQLLNNQIATGKHSIVWNGNNENGKQVSSGIYFYKLKVENKTKAVRKCLLLK